MAMRTETLPIAIFMQLSTANIEGTVALILILTTLGLLTLLGVRLLTSRRSDA
jgi:molybdate transport system permease protein